MRTRYSLRNLDTYHAAIRPNGPHTFATIPTLALGPHTTAPLPQVWSVEAWRRLFWYDRHTWWAAAVTPRADGTLHARLCGMGTVASRIRTIARIRYCLGLDEPLTDFYTCARRDPTWRTLTRRLNGLRPYRSAAPFESITRTVIRQLISAPAARTLTARLVTAAGPTVTIGNTTYHDFPSPKRLLRLSDAEYAKLGLARRAPLIKRLARLSPRAISAHEVSSDALALAIGNVSGIGAWTRDTFAYDGLGGDTLPADDITVRRAVGHLRHHDVPASLAEVQSFLEPVATHQGLAITYLFGHEWLRRRPHA